MKKLVLLLTVALFLLGLSACGGGKYADAKALIEKQIKITEDFVTACDGVQNADDAAKAITDFANGINSLKPEMEALDKKYPEMKEGEVPDELKPLITKVGEVSAKVPGAMGKLTAYSADEKVAEALKLLQGQ